MQNIYTGQYLLIDELVISNQVVSKHTGKIITWICQMKYTEMKSKY